MRANGSGDLGFGGGGVGFDGEGVVPLGGQIDFCGSGLRFGDG